jgi:hypothetical protein
MEPLSDYPPFDKVLQAESLFGRLAEECLSEIYKRNLP